MLSELYIENVAVIEKAAVSFSHGMTVLTGETGAGKSILIDAINAVLGGRTSKDLVRSGAEECRVSALFGELTPEIQALLEEMGFAPTEDGTLILSRKLSAAGKNLCRINGQPASVTMLRQLGGALVNIHGQHDSQALLNEEQHITFLDHFGELTPMLEEYRLLHRELVELRHRLRDTMIDEMEKTRKIDLLEYQIAEIESARLNPGEEEELTERRDLIRNSAHILQEMKTALGALEGEEDEGIEGAYGMLSLASQALVFASGRYPSLAALSDRVTELMYATESSAEELRLQVESMDFDPEELDQAEDRLELIHNLERKYGQTIEEMLDFLERAKEELSGITANDELRMRLQEEYEAKKALAFEKAQTLSDARKETARRFEAEIQRQLAFLDMPHVRFVTDVQKTKLTVNGIDAIRFLISTNPGEEPKPVSKIASGGELSRIILAIKNVLSSRDSVDTMIFDEVDTGVSGSAAQKIGQKLKELAGGKQVFSITHLAQVAAMADHHLLITKEVENGRTYTHVQELVQEQRAEELARMISGPNVTALMLENAREMLARGETVGKRAEKTSGYKAPKQN